MLTTMLASLIARRWVKPEIRGQPRQTSFVLRLVFDTTGLVRKLMTHNAVTWTQIMLLVLISELSKDLQKLSLI